MGIMKRVSIKRFLIGVVGLLAVILIAQSVMLFIDRYKITKEIERLDVANEFADAVIEAAGHEAKERGLTVIAINSTVATNASAMQNIREVREHGEKAWNKGMELAKTLVNDLDATNNALRVAMTRASARHAELDEARRKVDGEITTSKREFAAQDWIKGTTAFIDANAEMRLAAFSSTASRDTLQEALRMNLELKHGSGLSENTPAGSAPRSGISSRRASPLTQPHLKD